MRTAERTFQGVLDRFNAAVLNEARIVGVSLGGTF